MDTNQLFGAARRAPYGLLALFVGTHVLLKFLVFSHAFLVTSRSVSAASGGLLSPDSIAGILEGVLLVGFVCLLLGHNRPAEIGLRMRDFPNAALILFLVWAVAQAGTAAAASASSSMIVFNWPRAGVVSAGIVLQAFVTGALVEEVVFRGFVLRQTSFLSERLRSIGPARRLGGAILVAQIYFGLAHVPAAIRQAGSLAPAVGHVLMAIAMGVFFAALYLRTHNLLLVAGVHALINEPMPFIVSEFDPALVILIVSSGLLVSWVALAGRFEEVFTLQPVRAPATAT